MNMYQYLLATLLPLCFVLSAKVNGASDWVVSVKRNNKRVCAGVQIQYGLVLALAECVKKGQLKDYKIVGTDGKQQILSKEKSTIGKMLVLLRTDEEAECVKVFPEWANKGTPAKYDGKFRIYNFGESGKKKNSITSAITKVNVVGDGVCIKHGDGKKYKRDKHDCFIAKSDKLDSLCKISAGLPIFGRVNGKWVLLGFSTRKDNLCTDTYKQMTSIVPHESWIKEMFREYQECVDPRQPCWQSERATENLREVIIGQCTLFQQNINQPTFCVEGFRNCTEVWEAFFEAFKFQPRCDVDIKRLKKYFVLTDHSIPRDKSLFWENVYPFVQRYSNRGLRYYSISDTLPGYIGDGLQWCSDPNDPTGMSPAGTLCPGSEATPDCPQGAQRASWIAASENFARRASGEIFILLNATSNPMFANDTYNALYELPNLRENIVTKATVLLLNERPVQGQSKCDDPTLNIISSKVREKRIKYACIENRRDVVAAYCLDNPPSEVCKILNGKSSVVIG